MWHVIVLIPDHCLSIYLVCFSGYSSSSNTVQIMKFGLSGPFLSQSKIWEILQHTISWKSLQVGPSIGIQNYLNEYTKICEYKKSRPFFDF